MTVNSDGPCLGSMVTVIALPQRVRELDIHGAVHGRVFLYSMEALDNLFGPGVEAKRELLVVVADRLLVLRRIERPRTLVLLDLILFLPVSLGLSGVPLASTCLDILWKRRQPLLSSLYPQPNRRWTGRDHELSQTLWLSHRNLHRQHCAPRVPYNVVRLHLQVLQ